LWGRQNTHARARNFEETRREGSAEKNPQHLTNSTIKRFVESKVCDQQPLPPTKETGDIVRVVLPFKDQVSADTVKKQLKDLSLKVQTTIQPVLVSRKIDQEL